MPSNTYLLLDIFTLLGPLILSFDKRVAFFKGWKALFPAIFLTGVLFIAWDVWFTEMGVWGFNDDYLVGIRALGLPLEEWLFFLVVPYACVFIYEVMTYYFPTKPDRPWARSLAIGLSVVLMIIGLMTTDQWYTSLTFIGTSLLLALNVFVLKADYLGRFWKGYLVSLIPFYLVNGVLTALPVVWYNDAENFGIRMYSIPVEDSIYLLWLLLMCVNIYEWGKARMRKRANTPATSSSNRTPA